MKLAVIMIAAIAFLLTYALPMAVLPAEMAERFNTAAGVLTAIVYTVAYGLLLWYLWNVFRSGGVTDHPSR